MAATSQFPATFTPVCNLSESTTYEVHFLKVGTDGSSADSLVKQWQVANSRQYGTNGNSAYSYTQTQSAPVPNFLNSYMITNADQGALMSWQVAYEPYCAQGTDQGCQSNVQGWSEFHLANSTGGDVIWPAAVANQFDAVSPSLQLQDGSYVGTAFDNYDHPYMVKFNASGTTLGTADGGTSSRYFPQIATADGGLIAGSGSGGSAATFNANLSPTGQLQTLATYTWTGNAYMDDAVNQVTASILDVADASFSPESGANPSTNNTALQRCAPLDSNTSTSLESSYAKLKSLLLGPCPSCIASIFQPLGTYQAEFTAFLQQGHEFCNGNTSQEPGALIGSSRDNTVADYFKRESGSPDYAEAATEYTGKKTFPAKLFGVTFYTFSSTERKNFKVFFAPQNLSTDTADLESTELHEALHGFTGLGDGDPFTKTGLCYAIGPTATTKIINKYPDCYSATKDITYWLKDNIIAPPPPPK